MRDKVTPISKRAQLPKGITPAEAEVIEMAELHNKLIADKRNVSVHTVKRQMSSAFEKLGVDNRTSAALRWAEIKRAA
jgi:DNA-binding NarL/FixJ family response regulator